MCCLSQGYRGSNSLDSKPGQRSRQLWFLQNERTNQAIEVFKAQHLHTATRTFQDSFICIRHMVGTFPIPFNTMEKRIVLIRIPFNHEFPKFYFLKNATNSWKYVFCVKIIIKFNLGWHVKTNFWKIQENISDLWNSTVWWRCHTMGSCKACWNTIWKLQAAGG